MILDPLPPPARPTHFDAMLRRLLGGMSLFTMLMTIPQVLAIWVGHQAGGISILSWSAYLGSAVLWFLHSPASVGWGWMLPSLLAPSFMDKDGNRGFRWRSSRPTLARAGVGLS
jgi:hypothetical protein